MVYNKSAAECLMRRRANVQSEKKYIFLCVCVIVGLILIVLVPGKNVAPVENAVVNPANGDVAFTYFGTGSNIVLNLCDLNGEVLFSKGIDSAGGSYSIMAFSGENICIYISRTKMLHEFTRDGTRVQKTEMPREQVAMLDVWQGWESTRGRRQMEQNGYLYVYEYSSFPQYLFGEKHQLSIISPDGAIATIYLKEEKK